MVGRGRVREDGFAGDDAPRGVFPSIVGSPGMNPGVAPGSAGSGGSQGSGVAHLGY